MHPTRERLILTTVSLLDGGNIDKVHVEEVLARSGVSRGSLYHHFEDFNDLIEAALVYRFSATVDVSIQVITDVLTLSQTREEFFTGIKRVTLTTQSRELAVNRYERARSAGMAGSSDRFKVALGVEQHRITESLIDLFRDAQSKGWMNDRFDPHAAAILVQAYTLGKVIDDISPDQVDEQAWMDLISQLIDSMFG